MTDKVQKIREEVEMVVNRRLNLLNGDYFDLNEETNGFTNEIMDIIDSLQEEPVSEPNKELAETYLAVFDKKFPILPSLKGKQLADYKDFLNKCQQIFGLKEWGIRPIQSKLFEKLSLLWAAWGAEHLQGVGRQDEKEQDIPVSEGLEEAMQHSAPDNIGIDDLLYWRNGFITGTKWGRNQAMTEIQAQSMALAHGCHKEEPAIEDLGEYINELSKQFPEVSFAKLSRIAVRVAKWQKEQMIAKAIDGEILEMEDNDCAICSHTHLELCIEPDTLEKNGFKDNDKVKVFIIKED